MQHTFLRWWKMRGRSQIPVHALLSFSLGCLVIQRRALYFYPWIWPVGLFASVEIIETSIVLLHFAFLYFTLFFSFLLLYFSFFFLKSYRWLRYQSAPIIISIFLYWPINDFSFILLIIITIPNIIIIFFYLPINDFFFILFSFSWSRIDG